MPRGFEDTRMIAAAHAVAAHPPGHDHAAGAAHAEHEMHDMMYYMGHAPGMSMQHMARDMRNRFLVALFFSIPVFLYSAKGRMFGDFPTPFGMDRKLFLFIAATAAI